MTAAQTVGVAHTVEVALQSKAWWYWRCTCGQWGSAYHSEYYARKAADGHQHWVPAAGRPA